MGLLGSDQLGCMALLGYNQLGCTIHTRTHTQTLVALRERHYHQGTQKLAKIKV
jgi:hypothetical protein